MESPKVLNQPATPILIFFLTISLMLSVSVSEPYNYLQYVVQWQPAVCSIPKNRGSYPHYKRCTKLPKQNFTIHGLWPSKFSGAHVTYCKQGQAFDIKEVHPIQAELDECWPNMLGDNDRFWSDEWEKHGRCSLDVFSSQFEYFNRSVTLCNMYSERIKNILLRTIYPSNNDWWPSSSIANEIYKEFNRRPRLSCSKKYVRGPAYLPSDYVYPQLQEVILCFDAEGEDLIDCPRRRQKNDCPPYILFLQ